MGDKQRSADQEARVRTAPQRRPVAWVPAAESGDGVVQGDIADPDAVLTIDDSPTAHFETLKAPNELDQERGDVQSNARPTGAAIALAPGEAESRRISEDSGAVRHVYDLASATPDSGTLCASAPRLRTTSGTSVHIYDDPYEGHSEDDSEEDEGALKEWAAGKSLADDPLDVDSGADELTIYAPPANAIDELDTADWFHGKISIQAARLLLRNDGRVGAFLLRQSTQDPENRLALSFVAKHDVEFWRSGEAVKIPVHHVSIKRNTMTGGWLFAKEHFLTSQSLLHHLLGKPTMMSPDGSQIHLAHPCARPERDASEAPEETWVMSTSLQDAIDAATRDLPNAITPKLDPYKVRFDGYLTKQGHLRKNWKLRWFELYGCKLSYYKKAGDPIPKGVIDLRLATSISRADGITGKNGTNGKSYSLKLVLAKGDAVRVWLMYAATEDQIDEWIWNIRTAMGGS
eukprot:m.24805 g.24805  ORF g.24805 m.24805 type:complete len:460 (+) comp6120_c0_seq1:441-1820(+)